MPLTVAGALSEISVLSTAKVVAGNGGLQRVFQWAHVVDIPDAASWVRPGDLLLTTAFALKDNLPLQLELVPSLVQKGVAGLIVAIGRYFHEIPQQMVSLADDLAFPIVTLPLEIPFVEVTEAIHRRICNEQYELAERSLHIHRVLTALVLEERGLSCG